MADLSSQPAHVGDRQSSQLWAELCDCRRAMKEAWAAHDLFRKQVEDLRRRLSKILGFEGHYVRPDHLLVGEAEGLVKDRESMQDTLRTIGRLIGCGHVEDEGGWMRLTHCVEEVLDAKDDAVRAHDKALATAQEQLTAAKAAIADYKRLAEVRQQVIDANNAIKELTP